jgi:hypothetical protein
MCNVVKKNVHYLLTLIKYKKQARNLIRLADKNQIKALCKIVANVIYGNINIDEKYKRKLFGTRKVLTLIATKSKKELFCRRIIYKHYDKILLILEAVRSFLEIL